MSLPLICTKYSQGLVIGPYPEPIESSPHAHILCPLDPSECYPSNCARFLTKYTNGTYFLASCFLETVYFNQRCASGSKCLLLGCYHWLWAVNETFRVLLQVASTRRSCPGSTMRPVASQWSGLRGERLKGKR